MTTINVTVERVRHHDQDSGFSVVIGFDEESGEEVPIVGTFPPVQLGEPIAATGDWYIDRKWGRQFRAESVAPILPTSAEGIRAYLTAGYVDGIGQALAKRLIAQFGADLLRVIDEEPRRLLDVSGIGERVLRKITESWNEQHGVRKVMMFLASHGLGGARAFHIQKQYGDGAIAVIRQNPYRLAYDIRGIGFTTADQIAHKLGHDARSPFRLMAGLRHVMDMERGHGHCGVPVGLALREAAALLRVERDLVAATIESAVSTGVLIEEEVDGRRVLFEPWLHHAESRIAATLGKLAGARPKWHDIDPQEAIAVAEAESGMALDPVQRRAVSLALRSRAVVITGGPGVGKTTLVRALLVVFQSAQLRVALAAPTGRAAKRLGESTGGVAQTIHRLLEMSPKSGEFQRNDENPLEADAIIIDEASMVDVPLLDAVLEAMPPQSSIVLVGDADQLPSIGPGQVLHDVLQSERVPAIRLTEIHRQAQGSDIIQNAHSINRGGMPKFGKTPADSDMFFFPAASPDDAVAQVVDLVSARIPKRFGFRSMRDVQVLAPMRKGKAGIGALNRALQSALNPPSRHKAHVERPNGVLFSPGDKLMQTENNYEKNVFNGDVGVIATVDPAKELFTVDFGGDLIVDYTFHEADQLTLAYATTIHKSQGSEYQAVVIVLMPQHHLMLRRNLLYTAVTRGRRLVVVVGDRSSVKTAVLTGRGGERCTRLARCLRDGQTAMHRRASADGR